MFDKKIRENNYGKYLIIYSHEFEESIQFAQKNKIEQIQIRGAGAENINSTADFKEIVKLSPYLKTISFGDHVDNKIMNFESIYTLTNIENILINCKQNFIIDISQYKKLKHFGFEYWKGIKNIDKLENLESMVITKYPKENVNEFIGLKNLKILHIYSSKIETLDGIEKLNNLEELVLAYNRKLENIKNVKDVKSLKILRIEKCNNIKDYEFVDDVKNSNKIFIDIKAKRNN
jgi:internalin A